METLAIKYRPSDFDDVVGQGSTKLVLQNQLETGEIKQAYLFTGPAGTGKTTLARIHAKAVNKGKGRPIEIDCASNSGVDNIRTIIDDSKIKPMDCDYKVYIMDECHMLSNGAWNAMLKVLEEPPARTIFMMATTDPQKIPATILSRVQRFDIKKHSTDAIAKRLKHILDSENFEIRDIMQVDEDAFPYNLDALEYIAKLAEGGMRDAITMLDKCIAFNAEVTLPNVIDALGTADYETFFDLTASIERKEADKALKLIEDIYMEGKDLKQFTKQYTSFILDIIKYQLLEDFTYIGVPSTYVEDLNYFADINVSFYKEILETFIELNATIKWESNSKPFIEAEVLLLCL